MIYFLDRPKSRTVKVYSVYTHALWVPYFRMSSLSILHRPQSAGDISFGFWNFFTPTDTEAYQRRLVTFYWLYWSGWWLQGKIKYGNCPIWDLNQRPLSHWLDAATECRLHRPTGHIGKRKKPHTRKHAHTRTHTHETQTHTHTHTHTYTHKHETHTHTHTHTGNTHTHKHTHTRKHTYTHTHTHMGTKPL
jgi:hypothetical protein